MSQYLAFVMHLADAARWPESLRPLFKQQFFTPVSLVGSSLRKASLDFFLSGCGIGDLPGDNLLGNGWQTNEVRVAAPTDARQYAYLQTIAHALKSQTPLSFIELGSEWETFDLERHVSRLAASPLEENSLLECQFWAAGRKRLRFKMLGTVDFTSNCEGFTDLKNCFQFAWRCSDGSLAGWQPFLEVDLEAPEDGQDRVRLQLTAGSSIWLANSAPVKNPVTLGGGMTPAIADEFVNRYAILCRDLVESHQARIQTVSVGLGDAFSSERQRFQDAFRASLDNCPVPLEFW